MADKKEEYLKLLKLEAELDNLMNDSSEKERKMKLLHEYNDIKDATQIVINYIANIEGTTISDIHEKLQLKD